jgi:hypothetical protein
MRPSTIGTIRSRAFLAALIAAATGCGDSTGPGPRTGSLSFAHSGAVAGTYSASGSILGTSDPRAATWAAGSPDDANQAIDVMASTPRPSNTIDHVIIQVPASTGSVAIGDGAVVAIAFGQAPGGAATWTCTLGSGTVVVASLSGDRVIGSFSGTGSCLGSSTGLVAFTVTDGSFDVPLIPLIRP